jgi:iron complex transport system substrate-binding protein
VDEKLVQSLAPDLILTQNLCQVCAPSGNDINHVLKSLAKAPDILYLTPHTLNEIDENLRAVGRATNTLVRAEEIIRDGQTRLRKIETLLQAAPTSPRVFFMEWVDPIYCSGHWVPEMIQRAGGKDQLGRLGTDSVGLHWDDIRAYNPDILLVAPCGFNKDRAYEQISLLTTMPEWDELSAVKQKRVYGLDANSYFARPGPRVIDGIELLAHLFHPDLVNWKGPANAFESYFPKLQPLTPSFRG